MAGMAGMQGMGMGGPAKKPEPKIPKLIQNDKNNKLYKFINKGYGLFYIVGSFAKKLLWFVSCIGFMYIVPASFEIFMEQQRILQKI